ncbi:MAG: hypothetical protein LBP73_04145 [Clostridiales Family XIII bacterium]|jgi:hypothetical protein|nr:hypothetical protein [Clostridiales Family XIII bacterium]
MSDKTIRFIDSGYNELFSIMDGGRIRVTYPPGDGREPGVRQCKYLDDTHFEEAGNGTVWHICQFAERMEALGALYEPEFRVAAELAPGAIEDAKLFYRNREEGNTCIGHLRGDFGRSGDSFFHSWADHDGARKTPEFRAEFQAVMFELRRGVLKDHAAMAAYCRAHPEAKLPGDANLERYGFKLETETRQYFVRCTTLRDDYFYVWAYDKAPAVRERERPAEKPSVLKQLREAREAPKPPRKAKDQNKNKGDAEL